MGENLGGGRKGMASLRNIHTHKYTHTHGKVHRKVERWLKTSIPQHIHKYTRLNLPTAPDVQASSFIVSNCFFENNTPPCFSHLRHLNHICVETLNLKLFLMFAVLSGIRSMPVVDVIIQATWHPDWSQLCATTVKPRHEKHLSNIPVFAL